MIVYVSSTGSDSTGDGSLGNPYRTGSRAFQDIGFGGGAGAGDFVIFLDGTYTETFGTLPTGTSGNPFTLKALNRRLALFQPSNRFFNFVNPGNLYLNIEGLVLNAAGVNSNNIWTDPGCNDIAFVDIELKNTPSGGGTGLGASTACASTTGAAPPPWS